MKHDDQSAFYVNQNWPFCQIVNDLFKFSKYNNTYLKYTLSKLRN